MQMNSSLRATISVAKLLNSFIKDVICFLETVLQFGSVSVCNSKGIFSMGNSLSCFWWLSIWSLPVWGIFHWKPLVFKINVSCSKIFISSFLAPFCAGAGQVGAWITFAFRNYILFSISTGCKTRGCPYSNHAHINRYVDWINLSLSIADFEPGYMAGLPAVSIQVSIPFQQEFFFIFCRQDRKSVV